MSPTAEERLAALEARVKRLEAPKRDVEFYEGVIVEAMKQWARVTTLNFYNERNSSTREEERHGAHPSEVGSIADMFLRRAQLAAEDIVRVGAS